MSTTEIILLWAGGLLAISFIPRDTAIRMFLSGVSLGLIIAFFILKFYHK